MESSPGEKKQPAQGLFQCSTCQRTFARVDHLSRHVRSREPRNVSPWVSSAANRQVQIYRKGRSNARDVTRPSVVRTFRSTASTSISKPNPSYLRDLLKRHAACHEDTENGSKRQKQQHNHAPRVSQACRGCATAKLKCEDKKPCGRCQQRGIACEPDSRYHAKQARHDGTKSPRTALFLFPFLSPL